MNLTFADPWWLAALLIIPLVAWLRGRHGQPAALVYSSVDLARMVTRRVWARSGRILMLLRWVSISLAILALARPQSTESRSRVTASGIDIVLSVDLSDSMSAEDFERDSQPIDRLSITKEVLAEFIKARPSDRIGMVVFSGMAYIASPPTLDHDFLLANVRRLSIDTVPEEGTAIGSGLSAALNRLRDLKSKSKIVILMTDGQNNSGRIPPVAASEAAESLKIKVYTIGVGARGTARIPRMDPFGRKIYIPVNVDIDENMLRKIAERTGGKYFRADSADTLRNIYREIDQLEKTLIDSRRHHRHQDVYHWFLAGALLTFTLELLLGNTLWRRLP